jgi:hypothetical protein
MALKQEKNGQGWGIMPLVETKTVKKVQGLPIVPSADGNRGAGRSLQRLIMARKIK